MLQGLLKTEKRTENSANHSPCCRMRRPVRPLNATADYAAPKRLQLSLHVTQLHVLKDKSCRQTHNLVEEQLQILDGLSKEVTALHCKMKKLEGGWKIFSGKWYHFSFDLKNWTKSRDDCITLGGHLAIIENEEEKDFILTHGERWWVGLTDSKKEGTWFWVDNTPFTEEGSVPWAHKQPDNHLGPGGDPVNGEDCGLLLSSGLNDVACRKTFKSTCQSQSWCDTGTRHIFEK
ncbi:hypothetical protein AALO_G00299660 [Alosa alosa]|uniref:C-type lectin domain-containing protein n=1 Tax=Alosa alosa TaxID=278164 RepID=A0AAV6FF82_9TELE|nr:hypothetical protein AALO_G00299660 [Alosa alosa]